jgi:ABC-type multidrug transport system fused ATPase/permease subunit
MIKDLLNLFRNFSQKQKSQLLFVQFLMILSSLLEILSVLLIVPFISIIGSYSNFEDNIFIKKIYFLIKSHNKSDVIFYISLVMLLFYFISTVINILTINKSIKYGRLISSELTIRLFSYYLSKDILFHSKNSNSDLLKKLSQEVDRVTTGIIDPTILLNARLILIVLMLGVAFYFYSWLTLVVILIIFFGYSIAYFILRKRISFWGKKVSDQSNVMFKIILESLASLKYIIILKKKNFFIQKYKNSKTQHALSGGKNIMLSLMPRYFMEFIIFFIIITLIIITLKIYDDNLYNSLIALSFFGVIGFKLLPAVQGAFFYITTIQSHLSAYHSIELDLQNSKKQSDINSNFHENLTYSEKKIALEKDISIKNVSILYPEKKLPTIYDITIKIPAKKLVAFVGTTGSGKTTLINYIMGFLNCESGQMFIDNVIINKKNISEWQNNISFVPQDIFLLDASIKENIAFGTDKELIDNIKINKIVEIVQLKEFIKNLENGLETNIGSNGVKLSGGQKQRIAIARALYSDPELLILDEATNALDGITEENIMNCIFSFSGSKTVIIIAHRISTIKKCDIIYLFENGKIIDQGNFDDLTKRNKNFSLMYSFSN